MHIAMRLSATLCGRRSPDLWLSADTPPSKASGVGILDVR